MDEMMMVDKQDQKGEAALSSHQAKPHIVLIIPRGEVIRNFLYSDTLAILTRQARVTLLSVLDDEKFIGRFRDDVEAIIPLKYHRERRLVSYLHSLVHEAHFRWLWSEVAQNKWEMLDAKAQTPAAKVRRLIQKGMIYPLANRPTLEALTQVERLLSYRLRPTDTFDKLFARLKPDLVFNGSHIHGPAGRLPIEVAHRMGIPTAGFIFSWDNLTSRSRIFEPYDYYLVWHDHMRQQLLSIYPHLNPAQVFVTGTPQFDFHFKPDFWLSREALCKQIGIDPQRPYLFYTTGIDRHFPEEHHHVAFIADFLAESAITPKPQLVVRTYVKGTSDEMKALAAEDRPDVVFPPVLWEAKWHTPMYEDLKIYTNLLRHAHMGINPASTVSLELVMHDKPVMNIGFDPPGSRLPHHLRWQRHIDFDHYRLVADSGAVRVAYSQEEMRQIITQALQQPRADTAARQRFVREMFGETLDGRSGERVAHCLRTLVAQRQKV